MSLYQLTINKLYQGCAFFPEKIFHLFRRTLQEEITPDFFPRDVIIQYNCSELVQSPKGRKRVPNSVILATMSKARKLRGNTHE